MRDEISEVNSDLIISELHINNNKKITVLTAEINDFCDKAESANLDIVVLNIKSLENSIPWPGKVHIRAIISWEKAVRRFEKLKCFLICVSRGLISGPSLELLLTTDYRIVTSSSMLQLSLNRNLVWPGMALYRLSSHIGRSQTRKIIMSRAGLSAIEMLNLGLEH